MEILEVSLFEKDEVYEMLHCCKIVEVNIGASLWKYMFNNK